MNKLTFQFGSQFKVKHTVQPSTGPVMAPSMPMRAVVRSGMNSARVAPAFGKRPPERTWALRRSCPEWSLVPHQTKRSA